MQQLLFEPKLPSTICKEELVHSWSLYVGIKTESEPFHRYFDEKLHSPFANKLARGDATINTMTTENENPQTVAAADSSAVAAAKPPLSKKSKKKVSISPTHQVSIC